MGESVQRMVSKSDLKVLLLEIGALSNILPINSTCNVWCKFCSHGQNPPKVETYRIPAVSLDLAGQALALMDPGKPVVIGESVTRLMEGEPFVHPQIREILGLIRIKMPGTPVRITTNGTMLDRDMVKFLASLGNVAINLSLNSADERVRKELMGDPRAATAIRSAELMAEWNVTYHGSIVAMPHITGWDDTAGTIKHFDRNGAETVRVFLPGHTLLAPPALKVPRDLRERLHSFIEGIKSQVAVPVTMEPPLISDLDPAVAGVVVGSPARSAGIAVGDIIDRVDGKQVKSRVDAFRKVLAGENPALEVLRDGKRHLAKISKGKGQSSGLVFNYDMDPATIAAIVGAVRRRRARSAVLITSEMGFPAIKLGLEKLCDEAGHITPVVAENKFFGGSIGCAGLLTVGDMLEQAVRCRGKTDLIIVPEIAFDRRGRDITGRSYLDLKMENGPDLEVV
ncbi:MAG: DUF512 domain-containing protein [Desulfocucumaceae bacterium]